MKVLHSTVNLVPFSPIRNAKKLELQLRLEHVFRENRFSCSREHVIAVPSIPTYAGFE